MFTNRKTDFIIESLLDLPAAPGKVQHGYWLLGSDTSGSSDAVPLIVVNGAMAGPSLWIQGGLHGDEPNGSWTVSELSRRVDPVSLHGRLLLFPVLNVAAFRARQTVTPIDNGDMHKGFPGNPSGSYTQRIGHTLATVLPQVADAMIDVHSGTSSLFCTDFCAYPGDQKASAEAERMALATNAPIIARRVAQSETDKNLMFVYMTSIGVPSLFLSNGGNRRVEPQFFEALISMCLNVMQYMKMIPGEVTLKDPITIVKGVNYTFADTGGFVFNEAKNGDWLVEGQVVSRIYNAFGDEVTTVRCPYERAQLIESACGVVNAGELVAEWFLPL